MSYNLVDPTTGDLTRVAGGNNINDETTSTSTTWSSEKISADLADKQDFRIFNSLEEFNKKKGTSLTVVSGVDNMKDIANAMSEGDMLIIKVLYITSSEIYFGLDTSTGWTKIFTFIKSNGICDVECRTSKPATFKRLLNSDGLIGDWQELVTTDDIFLVGDRRNTIGWADLSNDVNIDGSSNYANNVGRIEGHNAIIEVSNPSIGYQWPVTNLGDRNNFMDFGGAIQFFVDKVNNHIYVRFANSVDMSAWGELATMDKVVKYPDWSNQQPITLTEITVDQDVYIELNQLSNYQIEGLKINGKEVSVSDSQDGLYSTRFSGYVKKGSVISYPYLTNANLVKVFPLV